MPTENVIRLRELLAGRFPNRNVLLDVSEQAAPPAPDLWRTGFPTLDDALEGGFPRSALSEVICPPDAIGSGTLLHALLRQAASENQIVVVVDGSDSLDVTRLEESVLSRLLWVRAGTAETAVQAVDILVRDRNPSLLLVDLALNPKAELRRIPSTTWYRFQRLVEERNMVCVFLTPYPMVTARAARVTLQSTPGPETFDRFASDVLGRLKTEIAEARPLLDSVRHRVA